MNIEREVREMTAAEIRWWKLFRDIIKAMPPTLELVVYNSTTSVCERGARQAAFERDGNADNVDDLEFIKTGHIHPNGEAL